MRSTASASNTRKCAAVVVTSARDRVFCSGGQHLHARRLEPRLEGQFLQVHQRDAQRARGFARDTAVSSSSPRSTGRAQGGGYELALACDEILLVDDRGSAVSLPEVPLLGVLPGTGGLTRLTDKRHVRHDLADVFCTTSEGVRGQKALDWRLVDHLAKPAQFAGEGSGAGSGARRHERPARIGQGRRTDADRADHRGGRAALFARFGGDRPGPAHGDAYRQGPARARSRRISRRSRRRARSGIRSRSRANWKTRSCRCAPTSSTSASG